VRAADVPSLAAQSFPLCMSLMVHHLHADRHLKHGARQQLGLFLKARSPARPPNCAARPPICCLPARPGTQAPPVEHM